MSAWLGSYRQKHASAISANSAERSASPRLVGRPACILPDDMPAGVGICPSCNEVRWLRAGPISTPCNACALLLADEAEVTLRGELP